MQRPPPTWRTSGGHPRQMSRVETFYEWLHAGYLSAREMVLVDAEFPDGIDVKKEIKDLKEAYKTLSDKIQEINERLVNLEYHPSIVGPIINERCQARLEGRELPSLPVVIDELKTKE